MVCKKCNKNLPSGYNGTKCPFCNSPLNKGYKNKYVKSDRLAGTGTEVAKTSFISLKKKKNNKDIELKDFNNYIDYKTAKEQALEKRDSKYYNVYSKGNHTNTTGAKKSKAKYIDKEKKKKESYTFTNNTKSSYTELIPGIKKEDDFKSSLGDVEQPVYQQTYNVPKDNQPTIAPVKKSNGGRLFFAVCFLSIIGLVAMMLYRSYATNDYYFGKNTTKISQNSSGKTTIIDDEMLQYQGKSKSNQNGKNAGLGITSIVYDNQYMEQMVLGNANEVLRLIASDSNRQKDNCLPEIVAIENEIINNYGITAVNFCEMSLDFAKELRDVVAYIYKTFPTARNYMTNITLANVDKVTYIAAFMPIFTFATSKTNTKYPVGIKSQIILNAKYFLNEKKLKNSVQYGTKSGYFPPNATRSSTVAHEFGHYLAYVALCNYHKSGRILFVKASDSNKMFEVYDDFNDGNFSYRILQEAYKKYTNTYHNDTSFDKFRESISAYAIAKDKNGLYIYDETIAEAFHDCYLNGELAQPASRMIVEVLLSYL